jgi:hypothetical protein
MKNIKDQPVELILLQMSHLKYKDILNLCSVNTQINKICKANKSTIAKYVLKNDYGFTKFPKDINYTDIVKYIISIRNVLPYNYKDNKQWKQNLLNWAASWGRLRVVKFLVKNGIDNLDQTLLDAVASGNLEIVKFLIESGANNFEKAIRKAKKQRNVEILDFLKKQVPLQTGGSNKKSKSKNKINYKVLSNKKKSCVKKKIGIVMKEFKTKRLHSSSGKLVTNPKQGIAIALSVARKYCL